MVTELPLDLVATLTNAQLKILKPTQCHDHHVPVQLPSSLCLQSSVLPVRTGAGAV